MTAVKDGWWEFRNPVRILFGSGRLAELPSLVGVRKTLLVTTPGFTKRGLTDRVRELLGAERLRVLDNVRSNPDLRDIEEDSQALLGEPIEVIVGLGGGSAIDTAKILSFILGAESPESLRAHFQDGAVLPQVTPLPVIAIPTTAGTGSEVTPFATIWDKRREKKYSLVTSKLYPEAALLDATLTLSLPQDVTVATGLDALSHGLEAIWNRNATPITTAYALEAIALVFDTLPQLVNALDGLKHRSQIMEASLLAGLAISRTRTGLAHSMSYPITARYGVPHGLACSFTLPAILDFNAQADHGHLAEVAKRLGFISVPVLRHKLLQLLVTLGVGGRLRQYVRSIDDLFELVSKMLTPGRADNNLRWARVDDLMAIIRAAWAALNESTALGL